jgi:hypothetical protein
LVQGGSIEQEERTPPQNSLRSFTAYLRVEADEKRRGEPDDTAHVYNIAHPAKSWVAVKRHSEGRRTVHVLGCYKSREDKDHAYVEQRAGPEAGHYGEGQIPRGGPTFLRAVSHGVKSHVREEERRRLR